MNQSDMNFWNSDKTGQGTFDKHIFVRVPYHEICFDFDNNGILLSAQTP